MPQKSKNPKIQELRDKKNQSRQGGGAERIKKAAPERTFDRSGTAGFAAGQRVIPGSRLLCGAPKFGFRHRPK